MSHRCGAARGAAPALVRFPAVIGLLAVVGLPAVAWLGTGTALAQEAPWLTPHRWAAERIDVRIDVARDGTLAVTADIAVDFRSLDRHGIFRDVPVRLAVPPEPWYDLPPDADPDALQRALDVTDVRVSSPDAPADLDLERPGPTGGTQLRIRIGDPDETVSGRRSYTIRYRVEDAMDAPGGPTGAAVGRGGTPTGRSRWGWRPRPSPGPTGSWRRTASGAGRAARSAAGQGTGPSRPPTCHPARP